MNNRHLPAGQPTGGGGAGGPGVDMGPGPGPGGGGPRRGGGRAHYSAHYQQHQHQHQHAHQHHQPQHAHQPPHMYGNYMNPYNAGPYGYAPPMPPQMYYQNGMSNGYSMPHPGQYTRSPPPVQYVPMMPGAMQPQPYSRPPQQSPVIVSTPAYQPPPPIQHSPAVASHPFPVPPYHAPPQGGHIPLPPPTPTSTHSSQVFAPPAPASPPQPVQSIPAEVPVASEPAPAVVLETKVEEPQEPFRPPLPWLSRPDLPFPKKSVKSRRRRRVIAADADDVELPVKAQEPAPEAVPEGATVTADRGTERAETPSTHDRSDLPSTTPTTPSSVQHAQPAAVATPTQTKPSGTQRPAVPAIPLVPAVPAISPKDTKSATRPAPAAEDSAAAAASRSDDNTASTVTAGQEDTEPTVAKPSAPAPPKLWTNLFAKTAPRTASTDAAPGGPNGVSSGGADNSSPASAGFAQSKANSMGDALRAYRVDGADKIHFLEPRGLSNIGQICYLNSVLQVLLYCQPFYDFLDQAGRKAAHSFKSDTPVLDAMIMFMREFKVTASAESTEQLCKRLKKEDMEHYGDSFSPEFVYDAFKTIKRFDAMKRGHQQDAQEFLGFILESLHEECCRAMGVPTTSVDDGSTTGQAVGSSESDAAKSWQEVGPRQTSATVRPSSIIYTQSPITKIFFGAFRNELRHPGNVSVTPQPYNTVQLDIDLPQVRNIVDAIRNIIKPETVSGTFEAHGRVSNTATKQQLFETLPPILMIQLKRFQYDEVHGTTKIWKKVGYPLDLEIPVEALSRPKRNQINSEGTGLPQYKLIAVVYHHGKNASVGHYTADVRRQDGREWIRMDDTVIRRVRSEDVIEGGGEEEPTRAQELARKENGTGTSTRSSSANRFAAMGDEDSGDNEGGWNTVSSSPGSVKKTGSSGVNGNAANKPRSKQVKESVKDNKVAYLLFYQRV